MKKESRKMVPTSWSKVEGKLRDGACQKDKKKKRKEKIDKEGNWAKWHR